MALYSVALLALLLPLCFAHIQNILIANKSVTLVPGPGPSLQIVLSAVNRSDSYQQWSIDGGFIASAAPGYTNFVWDVLAASKLAGAKVGAYTKNSATNQKWVVSGGVITSALASGFCAGPNATYTAIVMAYTTPPVFAITSTSLYNLAGVPIDVSYTKYISDTERIVHIFTVVHGAKSEVDLEPGTSLQSVSIPGGTAIFPASYTTTQPETITFTKRVVWDPTYLPKYTNFQFTENNNLATSFNTITGSDYNWYSAVGTTTIPYYPALKYVIDVEHYKASFFAVGGPSFTPVSSAWGVYGIPIGDITDVTKIRVIIDLLATPRCVSYINLLTNAPITPYGSGTDPNNPSHYPLRLVVSLPSIGSWVHVISQ